MDGEFFSAGKRAQKKTKEKGNLKGTIKIMQNKIFISMTANKNTNVYSI